MPELRRLYLENTWKLDGIERSPLLVNLEVFGFFEDLTPLCALRHLTHLTLSGGDYESLEPLVQLPELRKVVARRDTPQDYSPLAEAPKLHEIELDLCKINKVEVGSINAVLAPWSEEFSVEPARPLQPFELRVEKKPFDGGPKSPASPRDWGDDVKMGESEDRWFKRQVNRRLNRLLGKGWGHINERFASSPGMEHLTICRGQDIDRLPEIVDCLRGLIASAKYPWRFFFSVDSFAEYERDLEQIQEDGEETEQEFDAEREREEWEYSQQRQREHREFLERQYRFRLQQQQGMTVKPEEFAPVPPEPEEKEYNTEPEYDLGTRLNFAGMLTETSLVIHERDVSLAKMLLEIKD
jgi:hypothetical protein